MRWFRTSLLVLLLALAGCGSLRPASSSAGSQATAAREPSPNAAPPVIATEPPSDTTTETTVTPTAPVPSEVAAEPTEVATAAPAPAERTVIATESAAPTMPAETPAVGDSPAAAVWVQNGSRLIPVVIDRPQVIDLAAGSEAVSTGWVVISPDGSRFVYGVNTPGRLGIAIFDVGSGATSFIPGASVGARFSPDGRSLVYTLADQTSSSLVVRNLQTGEERTVHAGTAMDVPQAIDWLPTGIVVQRLLVPSDAPPHGLSLLDPESGELRTIRESGYLQADLTRDGTKAAVVPGTWSMGGIGEAGLMVVDVRTTAEQVIIPPGTGQIPAVRWSPDGARLAYSSLSEWEAPVRTLHLAVGDDYTPVTIDLGALGTLHDLEWRDSTTLLLLISDARGTLRLYAFPAAASAAAEAQAIGTYDAVARGQSAQILVARP